MLKLLDAGENVVACEITGGIAAEDLESMIARLEQSIRVHPKTHVFLQIDNLRDIDWKAVAANTPRGLHFLRDLSRFGRVAVVSDDRWVRAWTRAESALLPKVSYDVFHSQERARALDWVAGKIGEPHGPALTFLETGNPLVLAFELDGTVTPQEMDRAMDELEPRLDKEFGPLNVFARIGDLAVSEPASFLDARYFAFKKDVLERVDRYALVGGPRWLELMAKGLAPVLPFEIRHFPAEQEGEAWEWVGAHPIKSATSVRPQAEMV